MREVSLREAGAYGEVLFLDMHTGYGPRYQMTLTCSPLEKRSSGELKEIFGYPLVAKANPEEFYSMQGDMIDYFYSCMEKEWPAKPFFAAALGFGTLGEGLLPQVESIKAMIDENRAYHYGAVSDAVARETRLRFSNLFRPEEERWREKALADADQSLKGILGARGFWG